MRLIAFAPQVSVRVCTGGLALILIFIALSQQAGAQPAEKMTAEARKAAVLSTSPDLLRTLGSHLIVGYHSRSQLEPLLRRGAIGGVFLTTRNARGRTQQQLAAEISTIRSLAKMSQSRDLWVATDQEGGSVARLSPPLPRQRALGRLLHDGLAHGERISRAHAYALSKAARLAAIGVNLNFAPVVDLKRAGRLRGDRQTNLHLRALSSDAGLVAQLAKAYCKASAAMGVLCTLKHFPGLRTVNADTHVKKASVLASRRALDSRDWAPFRVANDQDLHAAIMMSHAQLDDLDANAPASVSQPVISGLLRRDWGFQGIVITDDLHMAAIRKRPGGIGRAAVEALNAGADLILITPGAGAIYEVLHALIEAHDSDKLDDAMLAASRRRLDRYAALFPPPAQQTVDAPVPTASPRRSAAITAPMSTSEGLAAAPLPLPSPRRSGAALVPMSSSSGRVAIAPVPEASPRRGSRRPLERRPRLSPTSTRER